LDRKHKKCQILPSDTSVQIPKVEFSQQAVVLKALGSATSLLIQSHTSFLFLVFFWGEGRLGFLLQGGGVDTFLYFLEPFSDQSALSSLILLDDMWRVFVLLNMTNTEQHLQPSRRHTLLNFTVEV